jgi:hypothetical protein
MANATAVYVLPEGAFTHETTLSLLAGPGIQLAASGAVNPDISHRYLITKAGVAALTLAAPVRDNITLEFTSTTANAHTITATGLLQTGSSAVNVATCAAFAGCTLYLRSFTGKWLVEGA